MLYRCFQRENIPELIMPEYIQSSNMCPFSDNKSIEGDQQNEWNVGKKIRQDIFMQGCQYEYRISSNKRQASKKRRRLICVAPLGIYSLGQNILKLYNVLVENRLTTSKTKRGISYSKLSIRVAAQLLKFRIFRILGNKEIFGKSQV